MLQFHYNVPAHSVAQFQRYSDCKHSGIGEMMAEA